MPAYRQMQQMIRVIRCPVAAAALCLAAPSLACDSRDGFKVVFAAGSFAAQHPTGSLLCDVDQVTIGVGDFVVLRRGDRVWRFQRAGRYKLADQQSQPVSVLAVLGRFMNPASWGLQGQSRNGAAKSLQSKPGDPPMLEPAPDPAELPAEDALPPSDAAPAQLTA